ncbi:MAG TPA: hypothetical protein VIF15_15640 [Polyangiaceae bacterium]|jgi:hypothetical protein
MGAIREQISSVLGWPLRQVRWIADQVADRVDASGKAARERYARARAENATKVIEVSPPSSRGAGPGQAATLRGRSPGR